MEDIYDFEVIVRGLSRPDGTRKIVVWSRRHRAIAHPEHVQQLGLGSATPSQLLDTQTAVSNLLAGHVLEVWGLQGGLFRPVEEPSVGDPRVDS